MFDGWRRRRREERAEELADFLEIRERAGATARCERCEERRQRLAEIRARSETLGVEMSVLLEPDDEGSGSDLLLPGAVGEDLTAILLALDSARSHHATGRVESLELAANQLDEAKRRAKGLLRTLDDLAELAREAANDPRANAARFAVALRDR